MVARSCRCAFPVCTVTTFFLLWYTVKLTTTTRRTATPAPIAIFFQAFITPHHPGNFVPAAKMLPKRYFTGKNLLPRASGEGHTSSDTVLLLRKFRTSEIGVSETRYGGEIDDYRPPEPPIIAPPFGRMHRFCNRA